MSARGGTKGDEALRLAGAVARKAVPDRVNGLAAEMAFFATLGLFPGLLVLGGLLGWLDTLAGSMVSDRAEAAVEFLDRVLTERGAGFVAAVRDLFDRERGVVVVSGLLLGGPAGRGGSPGPWPPGAVCALDRPQAAKHAHDHARHETR